MSKNKHIPSKQSEYLQEIKQIQKNILSNSWSLIFVFASLIFLGTGAMSWVYYNLVIGTLEPQITINVQLVGTLLAEKLSYATSQGVALTDLRAVDEFVRSFTSNITAISHIIIADQNGNPLHSVNLLNKTLPSTPPDFINNITNQSEINSKVGEIQIYLAIEAFQQILDDLKYEILTLGTIAMFLSIDLLNSFYVMRIYDPLAAIFKHITNLCKGQFNQQIIFPQNDEVATLAKSINSYINKCNEKFSDIFYDAEEAMDSQIDKQKTNTIAKLMQNIKNKYSFSHNQRANIKTMQSVMAIKIPLLIFVMGQELSTAFLPVYFRQLPSSLPLSPEFSVGLTFAGFLFAPLISMIFSNKLFSAFSMRTCLIAGATISMLTLYALSQVETLEQAFAMRTINGLGYGLIFISAQIHIARLSNNEDRAKNSAVFARTMYSAVFFCPVIGGIISEQLGYQPIFILSALICFISIIAMLILLQGAERKKLYPNEDSQTENINEKNIKTQKNIPLLQKWKSNHKILLWAVFGSVPAKIIHFGIIMFIMPLVLFDIGFRAVEIGHTMMLFGFLLLLCIPYVGKHIDKHNNPQTLLNIGGAISILASIVLFLPYPLTLVAAVALFGIAQAMVMPALQTLVQKVGINNSMDDQQINSIIGDNLTVFRISERIGVIIGIVLLSLLIGLGGYFYAFLFILLFQAFSFLALLLTQFYNSPVARDLLVEQG